QSLERVRAEGGELYGSAGELFSDAVFGRDSAEAAEDVLHIRPDIAVEVILSLARLQGTVDAPPGPNSNEEEVGKIHHEHRSLYVGTRRIPYQAWKDSGTSYLHADGSLAYYDQPIASVEVQGYAYDALLAAAQLLPDRAEQCRQLASRLRQSLLEGFWMPRSSYFAMAL